LKKLKFIITNRSIDKRELRELEERLMMKLPNSYIEFLLTNNGGLPTECTFDISDYNQSSIVFYGVNTGDEHSDLLVNYEAYEKRLPEKILPIGFDPGSNLICLSISDGKILFWDHEKENFPPELTKMDVINKSFEVFIETLEYEENEEW
jgi:hypothetical protein